MTKFKLVPVEPTREMILAGKRTIKGAETTFEGILADMAYKSMLAAAPSPWISVGERLPEPENGSRESGLVLTYNPYGIIVGFYCHEEALWYCSDGEEIDQYVSKITHWMPLPEAPEKREWKWSK